MVSHPERRELMKLILLYGHVVRNTDNICIRPPCFAWHLLGGLECRHVGLSGILSSPALSRMYYFESSKLAGTVQRTNASNFVHGKDSPLLDLIASD